MVELLVHPEALDEFIQAADFYEGRAPGLGQEFFEEVHRVWRAHITPCSSSRVHDWFVLDLGVVWDTATIDVPAIRPIVESLLDKIDGRA